MKIKPETKTKFSRLLSKSPAALILLAAFFVSGCELGSSGPDDGGVYKSTDQGLTFEQKIKVGEELSMDGENILSLRLDPSNSNVVYAGTPRLGLLRSEDGGETWKRNQANFKNAADIFIDPRGSSWMYAFAQLPEGNGKILKSLDAGVTWEEIFTDVVGQSNIMSFALDRQSPNILYIGDKVGGIYKSTDGGETWKSLLWAKSGIKKIVIDNVNHEKVYFSTVSSGALRTDDGGESFTSLKTSTTVYNLVAHPYQENSIFISDKNGVHRSDDGGMTLNQLNTLIKPESLGTRGLAIHPKDDRIIYLASRNVFYKSTDGGETWKAIPLNIGRIIKIIEINPDNPNLIYLGTYKMESSGGLKLFPF